MVHYNFKFETIVNMSSIISKTNEEKQEHESEFTLSENLKR